MQQSGLAFIQQVFLVFIIISDLGEEARTVVVEAEEMLYFFFDMLFPVLDCLLFSRQSFVYNAPETFSLV